MEKIHDKIFIDNYSNIEELHKYIIEIQKYGYIAHDYECYLQENGKIALIDFGGFIKK